jgi:hypothetical protein
MWEREKIFSRLDQFKACAEATFCGVSHHLNQWTLHLSLYLYLPQARDRVRVMSNTEEKILEATAGVTQSFAPVQAICAVLNGFHNYASDNTRTVEVNHFCSHPQPDFRQCLLYDSSPSDKNAKLIGVEYMIPISRFETLPQEEKKYWHTHFHEVKSGLLVMPKPSLIPNAAWDIAETKEMGNLVNWVGKTYHFWQIDKGHELPFGKPQLMMSIKNSGQEEEAKVKERNERYNVDGNHKQQLRKDIVLPPAPEGCDGFNEG